MNRFSTSSRNPQVFHDAGIGALFLEAGHQASRLPCRRLDDQGMFGDIDGCPVLEFSPESSNDTEPLFHEKPLERGKTA